MRFFKLRSVQVHGNCAQHGGYDVQCFEGQEDFIVCPQCEAEEAERERERVIAERQLRHFINSHVPLAYRDATIETYRPQTRSQQDAVDIMYEFARSLDAFILMYMGSNGVGKTHLACAAILSTPHARFATAYEIYTRAKSTMSDIAGELLMDVVKDYIRPPLLVIDDFGRSSNTDFARDIFGEIICRRESEMCKTIITTNLHARKDCPRGEGGCQYCLEAYMGNNVLSRLYSRYVFRIDGPDYRKLAHKGKQGTRIVAQSAT